MRNIVRSLAISGLAGALAACAATQAPAPVPPAPSSADTRFDGTYAFVSSTQLNASYRTRGGLMGTCENRTTGPLTISQGRAQYITTTGVHLTGTVAPDGSLSLRSLTPPGSNGFQPLDIIVSGAIDPGGTARARQIANSCSYEFVWRKQA